MNRAQAIIRKLIGNERRDVYRSSGPFMVGKPKGLVSSGNINLYQRPKVKNKDGSVSTVRSVSYNIGGKEILIPTVIGNRVVSNREALNNYMKTKKHLGIFKDTGSANRYAEALHRQQKNWYG